MQGKEHIILYIHGMGGGADSRIPSVLNEHLSAYAAEPVRVVVRTYSFDPEEACAQIDSWMEELKPELVLGESLGACHAIRLKGVPHILVSPSLNGPLYLGFLAWAALIPGVTAWLDRVYKPREGDRQSLHFVFRTLRKYRRFRREALANSPSRGSHDFFFAFFGDSDHYRRSGIVSIKSWRRHFGNTFSTYPGTHFMEEEFILDRLIPKIIQTLEFS
ncbi:MAG: hypothetical protein ACI39U_07075 [Candidatus Cryptobacteroides sp.]